MKNKKNQKKFIYKKIEKRQRSCWVLQKGEGLFISLKALCGLLQLKISNIGTAWTCRIYIKVLIAYNMRAISMKDAFCHFWRIGRFFRTRWHIISLWQKMRSKRLFQSATRRRSYYNLFAHVFIFDASLSFCILIFFIPYLCVFHFSFFSFFSFSSLNIIGAFSFFVFLSLCFSYFIYLLTYYLSHGYLSNI